MTQHKLAFYNRPFPGVTSYFDLIDLSAQYGHSAFEGFNHMELKQPDPEAARRIRQYADAKGISCCCFSVYADIVGENATEQIDRMKRFAEVAQILGSPFLHHTIAPHAKKENLQGDELDRLFAKGVAGVREIFDYAQELGVRCVYEDQAFLFNGVERFGRFLREVERNVGVVADVGNICQMDQEILPFLHQFHQRIVHVHLKDMKPVGADHPKALTTWNGNFFAETPVGTGTVKLAEAIDTLRQYGYDGYYALEYGAPQDDSPEIDLALEKIKKWLG